VRHALPPRLRCALEQRGCPFAQLDAFARPPAPEALERENAVRLATRGVIARSISFHDRPSRVLSRLSLSGEAHIDVTEPRMPGTGERRVVDASQQGRSGYQRLDALCPLADEVQRLRPAQGQLELLAIALARARGVTEGRQRVLQRLGRLAMSVAACRLLGESTQMVDGLRPRSGLTIVKGERAGDIRRLGTVQRL
jgi:hypothetical protein